MPPRSSEPKFHCTASSCGKVIKTTFDAFLHPLLNCLVCRKCHGEYKTGDFSLFEDGVDEFGDDNYCRWCVDGGNLFSCNNILGDDPTSKCHYSFCTDCIKTNFPDDDVLKAEELGDDYKWHCYACDPSKMEQLRSAARDAIIQMSQRDLKRSKENTASDKNASNKIASNKLIHDAEVSSTKTVDSPDNEILGSATKKRKIDLIPTSQSNKSNSTTQSTETPKDKDRDRNKDKVPEKSHEKLREKDREMAREKDRVKEKEKEKDREKAKEEEKERQRLKDKEKEGEKERQRLKDKEKEAEKERQRLKDKEKEEEKEKEKLKVKDKEKEKDKDKDKDAFREPETVNKPPIEPVRPVTSTLRNLKSPSSSIPKPNTSTPTAQRESLPVDKNSGKNTINSVSKNRPGPTPVAQTNAGSEPRPKALGLSLNAGASDASKTKPVTNAVNLQFRSGPSKQLKPTNEAVTPTTRVRLTDKDLKERLDFYGKTKDCCVKEINEKFTSIIEMFFAQENNNLLKSEIDLIQKPLDDFKKMINDLKSLYSSQRP